MTEPIVLFCLPFAGGSSLSYAPWRAPLLAAGILMRALDYPGRGLRPDWQTLPTVSGLIDILKSEVAPASLSETYYIFGHSFGALLTYELAASLKCAGYPGPAAVFLSGSNPPHRVKQKDRRLLDDEGMLEFIGGYGGIDARILESVAARQTLLGMLRADYQALETHKWAFRGALDAPIVLFASNNDIAIDSGVKKEWARYSLARMEICELGSAGHLYLRCQQATIIDKIVATVQLGSLLTFGGLDV